MNEPDTDAERPETAEFAVPSGGARRGRHARPAGEEAAPAEPEDDETADEPEAGPPVDEESGDEPEADAEPKAEPGDDDASDDEDAAEEAAAAPAAADESGDDAPGAEPDEPAGPSEEEPPEPFEPVAADDPTVTRPEPLPEPPSDRLPALRPDRLPVPRSAAPTVEERLPALPEERPTASASGQWSAPWSPAAPPPEPVTAFRPEPEAGPRPDPGYAPPFEAEFPSHHEPQHEPQHGPRYEQEPQEPPRWVTEREQEPPPIPAYAHAYDEEPRRRRWPLVTLLVAVLLIAGVVAGQLLRPVPEPDLVLALPASHTFAGTKPVLPWPVNGQSAVAVDGLGTMGASGPSAPTPTASVAKVMTAYVFLHEHPLASGADGPEYAVSAQGVADLPGRRQRGESLLGITAGQHLTERKALEALLLISANDVAHELARWDAGTEVDFVAKMNATARSLGMTSTTYTDPSGYDARTVSTAADQVKLLTAAMRVKAFTEVVANRMFVPGDGGAARPAGNLLLGRYGVVGGKTGYTDKAGGNYVFAARKRIGTVTVLIVGAVMAQRSPSAVGAINVGERLVAAAENALTAERVARTGDTVARVEDGLGGSTPVRAVSSVTVVGWRGLTVPLHVLGDPPRSADAGERIGTVTAGPGHFALAPATALDGPSLQHRLLRLR